jgi:hypothetical protein
MLKKKQPQVSSFKAHAIIQEDSIGPFGTYPKQKRRPWNSVLPCVMRRATDMLSRLLPLSALSPPLVFVEQWMPLAVNMAVWALRDGGSDSGFE